MIASSFFSTMKRYAGKARTIRNEIRTRRILNALPPEIRADIGWPDWHLDRGDRTKFR